MAKHRRETTVDATVESDGTSTVSTSVDKGSATSRKRAIGLTVAALLAVPLAAGAFIALSQQLRPVDSYDEGSCAAEALLELSPEASSLEAQAFTRGGSLCPVTKLEVRTIGDTVSLTEWGYGIEGLRYDEEAGTCSWNGVDESVDCAPDEDLTESVVRPALLSQGELVPEGLKGQWTGILSSRAQPMLKLPLELDEDRAIELAG